MATKATKGAELMKAAERIMRAKEGPAKEILRTAVRTGLLAPVTPAERTPGSVLDNAIHCAELARIRIDGRRGWGEEPEGLLAFLAQALEDLEQLADSVAGELAATEAPRPPADRVAHDEGALRVAREDARRETRALLAELGARSSPRVLERKAKSALRAVGMLWETSARVNENRAESRA